VEPIDSLYPEDEFEDVGDQPATTANLLFEIWDSKQRKMRIVLEDIIPLRRWVHLVVTTTDMDIVRPTWVIYVDGKRVYEHLDGFMPQKSLLMKNYIGKSNWESATSQYQDRDQRFRGSLFDFRLYRTPMAKSKVSATYNWGLEKLDLLRTSATGSNTGEAGEGKRTSEVLKRYAIVEKGGKLEEGLKAAGNQVIPKLP
jgi:hypothetical protein